MKGAIQIARLFGIPVQVHWSFLLIFVWVFYVGTGQSWDWVSMLWAFLFVLALFFCVVLHEFGHALTARHYGVNTRDIILSPIGGVARLDRLPEDPLHEFMVAIAGPLVNVGIGILLSAVSLAASGESRRQFFDFFAGILFPESNFFTAGLSQADYFIFGLIALNIVLAVFNMLPAFPMDGGRVLRALLSLRLGRLRATRVASFIGQGFAVLLVGYGLWSFSLITALIGGFVFMTAWNEYRMVKLDGMLAKHTVGEALRRKFTPLYLTDSLELALQYYRQGLEKNFLVFDQWHNLSGVLTEKVLVEAAKQKEPENVQPLDELVNRQYEALLPDDRLSHAFAMAYAKKNGILPVYEKGKLIGVIDGVSLQRFISLQQKLEKGR